MTAAHEVSPGASTIILRLSSLPVSHFKTNDVRRRQGALLYQGFGEGSVQETLEDKVTWQTKMFFSRVSRRTEIAANSSMSNISEGVFPEISVI